MRNRIKFIFTRLSMLSAPLALIGTVIYFKIDYSFSKAFQLGTLVSIGAFLVSAIFFTLLYMLIYPILASIDNKRNETHQERPKRPKRKKQFTSNLDMGVDKKGIKPKSEDEPSSSKEVKEIAKPKAEDEPSSTKRVKEIIKQKVEKVVEKKSSDRKSKDIEETKKVLKELSQSGGLHDEMMVILPFELSYLFAKESLKSLSFGKIKEEDKETGIIIGTAGFGSSPQHIKLTVQSSTKQSTIIEILSKSSTKKQSDKNNRAYIEKIFAFIREKEEFYINEC
ncbi:hypothetical protein MNB_SV-6-1323 [hydrothermal vent metagenome]|uniref:Uncharacterized protein n=1 Tax=hydrothermal vent metagenome TaxID=652676 RepID=A0A1W1BEG0_9ZZZZ